MKIGSNISGYGKRWASVLALGWLIVFLVATYDFIFAWTYRHVLTCWEMNPLVLWAVTHIGLGAVGGFKLAGLMLTTGLVWHCRHTRPRLARTLSLFVVGVYGLLAVHYIVGYQQPTRHELACRAAAAYHAR